MIEKATFRNFKSLRQVDVEFERLTAIVGPNAAGKTSVLEGLWLLSRGLSSDLKKVLTGRQRPGSLFSRGVSNQELQIAAYETAVALRLCIGFQWPLFEEGIPGSIPVEWEHGAQLQWKRPGQSVTDWTDLVTEGNSRNIPKELTASNVRHAELLRLDTSTLAAPSHSDQPRPRLGRNGERLASALAFLALNQPNQFQSLQDRLRSIIPSVERIRFDRVSIVRQDTQEVSGVMGTRVEAIDKEYIDDAIVFDFKGAPDVPAELVSEGTLLVLALLTALLNPARPRLLLIDDLDRGLHPKAQRKLIPMIRAILDQNRDLQIIATTHSPYLVDELDPKEVRVTWAGEDGVTTCARLDEHPDLARWKDEMWPGEFWSLVGERWVANGEGPERE